MPCGLPGTCFFAWNHGLAMLLAPRETRRAWVRKAASWVILAGLAGCAPRPAPEAAPPPAPLRESIPLLPPVVPQAPDWRDLPLSPGYWSYAAAPDGSRAL